MHTRHLLPLGLCAFLLASCAALERTPGVVLATKPAGARVMVDGKDSGFVTPCHLALSRETHHVDLVLEGYRPATVRVEPGGRTWLIHWSEAYLYEQVWRFPLWLNARDGLYPLKIEEHLEPARVFVPLALVEGRDEPRRSPP